MTKSTRRHAPRTHKPKPHKSISYELPRPRGKLGLIIDQLSTASGATANELVELTGWKRHSVLGALSRLKSRGFEFNLEVHSDRKFYRLVASEAVSNAP